MTELEKLKTGQLYNPDDLELVKLRQCAKEQCFEYNQYCPNDVDIRNAVIRKMVDTIGSTFWIEPPFYCDYGFNIQIGDNFYSNHNLIILDGAKVTIGNHVMIATNVVLATAGHPILAEQRNKPLEYSKPIVIKDNVWIGSGVTVNPGVVIGENTVIGSGSVVTSDIPDNVVAYGNPCIVKRKITDADKIQKNII